MSNSQDEFFEVIANESLFRPTTHNDVDLWVTQFGPRGYCQQLTVRTIPVEKTVQLVLVREEDYSEALRTGQVKRLSDNPIRGDDEVTAWQYLPLCFHSNVALWGKTTTATTTEASVKSMPAPEQLVVSREFLESQAQQALQQRTGDKTLPVQPRLHGTPNDSYSEFEFKFTFAKLGEGMSDHYRLLFFVDRTQPTTPDPVPGMMTIEMIEKVKQFKINDDKKQLHEDWCKHLRQREWKQCRDLVRDKVNQDQIDWEFPQNFGNKEEVATLLLLLVQKSNDSEKDDDNEICEVIDELMAKNCNPNFQNNSGTTALHRAGTAGSISVFNKLLDVGGDSMMRTHKGKYLPLHNAMVKPEWGRTQHPDFVREALLKYDHRDCGRDWNAVRDLTCDPQSKALREKIDLVQIENLIQELEMGTANNNKASNDPVAV